MSIDEYQSIINNAPAHLKPIDLIAFHTRMRKGELLNLQWKKNIDKKSGFIRLTADMTKEKKAKTIPINYHVQKALR